MKNLLNDLEISRRVFYDIVTSKEVNGLVADWCGFEKLPRFIFSGVGKNWYICEKVVKTYLSLGIQAQALDCVHALHGDLGMLMDDEPKVLFFISKSGTTEELRRLVKVVFDLRDKGIINNLKVIGFYLNERKNIEQADKYDQLILLPNWIYYKNFPEFDERDLVPTLSLDTMQMDLDYIGIEVYEAHPDLVDNYVYNHLGGNNGKALNSDKLVNI